MILIDIRHNAEAPVLPMIKALGKARENAAGGGETRLAEVPRGLPGTRSPDVRRGGEGAFGERLSLREPRPLLTCGW